MAEMADALDLGSSPFEGVGSTPTSRTKETKQYTLSLFLFHR